MCGAGTQQLLSEHFSTGSTNLSFSNSTGMWMSAEQLVKSYHQINAPCTHTLASPRLFGIGIHWFQKHSLPAPQAQNYPPADGHSACLLQGSTKLFLPPHLHCSRGFSKRKEKLTSVCLTYREWRLPYIRQGRGMCVCVCVEEYILFPCSATKSASQKPSFQRIQDRNISRRNCRLLEFSFFQLRSSVC